MKCEACALKCNSKYNASVGWGNPEAKMVILLDSPGDILAEKLLIWLLRKCSLSASDVFVDYLVKCPLPKDAHKKDIASWYITCWNQYPRYEVLNNTSLVICGNWGVDFVLQGKMKNFHGRRDEETGAWVTYSMKYLLIKPSECVEAWRLLYKAAQEAGLTPKMIVDIEMFKFPPKKLLA